MSVSFRPGARLTHMKGMPYQFLFYARHGETMEEVAVYECLYVNPRGTLWVRPRAMFEETVERLHEKSVPRFSQYLAENGEPVCVHQASPVTRRLC